MHIDRCDFDNLARYDIVVGIPHPVDGLVVKARPLLVLSGPAFHYHMGRALVLWMTASAADRYAFQVPTIRWAEAGLHGPGCISCTAQTLEIKRISRKVGRLQPEDIAAFEANWRELTGEDEQALAF